MVNLAASGTIWPGSVVIRDTSANRVSAASSSLGTSTAILGVAMDYVQGASDAYTRVQLFEPGQLWEADTVNAVTTANILVRHTLADERYVRNIANTYETASTGIFLGLNIVGSTSGSGRLVGQFLQHVPLKQGNYTQVG